MKCCLQAVLDELLHFLRAHTMVPWCYGSVTKNFVRLKIIILGQKTFCPLLKFFVRSLYIAINARGRELCLTVILTKMP